MAHPEIDPHAFLAGIDERYAGGNTPSAVAMRAELMNPCDLLRLHLGNTYTHCALKDGIADALARLESVST